MAELETQQQVENQPEEQIKLKKKKSVKKKKSKSKKRDRKNIFAPHSSDDEPLVNKLPTPPLEAPRKFSYSEDDDIPLAFNIRTNSPASSLHSRNSSPYHHRNPTSSSTGSSLGSPVSRRSKLVNIPGLDLSRRPSCNSAKSSKSTDMRKKKVHHDLEIRKGKSAEDFSRLRNEAPRDKLRPHEKNVPRIPNATQEMPIDIRKQDNGPSMAVGKNQQVQPIYKETNPHVDSQLNNKNVVAAPLTQIPNMDTRTIQQTKPTSKSKPGLVQSLFCCFSAEYQSDSEKQPEQFEFKELPKVKITSMDFDFDLGNSFDIKLPMDTKTEVPKEPIKNSATDLKQAVLQPGPSAEVFDFYSGMLNSNIDLGDLLESINVEEEKTTVGRNLYRQDMEMARALWK